MKSLPIFAFAAFMLATPTKSFGGPWGASVRLEAEEKIRLQKEAEAKKEELKLIAKINHQVDLENQKLTKALHDVKLELLALRQIVGIDSERLNEEKKRILETQKELDRLRE